MEKEVVHTLDGAILNTAQNLSVSDIILLPVFSILTTYINYVIFQLFRPDLCRTDFYGVTMPGNGDYEGQVFFK